jgi:hypothetical protein
MQIRCAYLSLFSHLSLLNANVMRTSQRDLCLHLVAEMYGSPDAKFGKLFEVAHAAR